MPRNMCGRHRSDCCSPHFSQSCRAYTGDKSVGYRSQRLDRRRRRSDPLSRATVPTAPAFGPVEELLLTLLDQLREEADYAQGYGPANLIALLRLQRGHLSGLDLSHLSIRGAYLQGIEMQDATLSGALIRDTVFTEAVSATWAVAISLDGKWWAAGGHAGESAHLGWSAMPDSPADLAGTHRYGVGPRLQPGWTNPGQREFGWHHQAVGRGEHGCSALDGWQKAVPNVWPLPPMRACSPAEGWMRPFGSGTRVATGLARGRICRR